MAFNLPVYPLTSAESFLDAMSALIILMVLVAYFCGSLSSAIIICRVFNLPDPRHEGSGNPGATNVLRIGGPVPALLVFCCDILKGTIPVWGSYFLGVPPIALGFIAIAACLGHMYPLFFRFQGGKAVATAFGTILPIGLGLGGLLLGTWLFVVLATGFASLGSLVAVSLSPIYTFLIKPLYTLPVLMLSILIVARHRENIIRLFHGQESKIWDKGKRLRE